MYNHQRYTIRKYGHIAFIEDSEGKQVDLPELQGVLFSLQHLSLLMSQGKSQNDVIFMTLNHMVSIATEGEQKVLFPSSRESMKGLGGCVYFLSAEARPGQIKIGSSKNLLTRLSQVKGELGPGEISKKLTIHAIIETAHFRELESLYHTYFDKINGDWFEAAPVLRYIEHLRTQYRGPSSRVTL